MSDWQPIETAPTDTDDHFLLKLEPIEPFENEPDHYCTVGCWYDGWAERVITSCHAHYPIDARYKVTGWKPLDEEPNQ